MTRIQVWYYTPIVTLTRCMKAQNETNGQKEQWRDKTLDTICKLLNQQAEAIEALGAESEREEAET